ncbi:CBS domain-containing protein [Streptomyces sp. HUAS MG91]|uniref:CBS domain-containing protein n=1 Tax=Streptomyces tabacisoli TaxID=3156398 RepID=A0AAU8INK2_9ACTN
MRAACCHHAPAPRRSGQLIDHREDAAIVRAWTIRGGSQGEREAMALDQGLVVVGWDEVGDLSACKSIDDVGTVLEESYPDAASRTLVNWKHQLWRFLTMDIGDLVVMPRKFQQIVSIGELTGPYEYRADQPAGSRHVRTANWRVRALDRAAIKGDLRDSMGSFLTISELTRREAVQRVTALLQGGRDPGFTGGIEPPADPDALEADVANAGTRQLTARDLIALWGWSRRTSGVTEVVDQELAARDLTVEPHFNSVRLDDLVTVSSASDETGTTDESSELDASLSGQSSSGDPFKKTPADQDLGWRIGTLPFARDVTTIPIDGELGLAYSHMVESDFSQLPVVDRNGRTQGVVTWQSIARAKLTGRGNTVAEVTDRNAPTARETEELFSRIQDLRRHGFLVIVDGDHLVTGVLTASDIADQLKLRIEPFTLLEEVELRLRRTLNRFKQDDLPARTQNLLQKKGRITLGEYRYVLQEPALWSHLNWPFDQQSFLERLDVVKKFRDSVAHWDVDAPEAEREAVEATRQLLRLLQLVA